MIQLLFVIAAFALVGFRFYKEFAKDAVGFRRPTLPRITDGELRAHLQQIAFFRKLRAEDQLRFIGRVQWITEHKVFQGMEGQAITNEIRAIIAASAVQVGFGLDQWKFPSFHTFRIYPESFYSNLMRRYLKGGAGKTGQIWFSLHHYREGYADSENGINLGLHEMAHALIIEMQNGNLDHDFTHAYEVIERIAKDRIPKIRSKQFTYLREYAGTNEMEFIAVTSEYFFEQPEKLSAADRELYEAFSQLYRQNPVPAGSDRPKITPLNYDEIEKEEKTKRNYRFAKWHWSLTLVLIGIFLAPAFLAFLMPQVALSFTDCWIIAGVVLVASSFFLYRPIVKSGGLGPTQFFLCHFFGLWPLVFAAVMLLNNLIPVWKQGEAHQVSRVRWENATTAIVNYTDNLFSPDKGFNIVKVERNGLAEGDYVIVVKQYGLFGIPIYGDHIPVHSSLHSSSGTDQ
jgi:Mlc titration factor MtfA (ptsG expression regulator)